VSYRGRFAPTPSGPLHLGSLLTALASYLQARFQKGQWLVRIDDLDKPRCVSGADTVILRQLEAHALHWDETPRYQSEHQPRYEATLQHLQDEGLLYACACTRAILVADSRPSPDGPVYAGTCRQLKLDAANRTLRLRITETGDEFEDGCQGQQSRWLSSQVGDFVVRRNDGQIGYQLACAIDEADQGISEVVRGGDLLGSTFQQRALLRQLGLVSPEYRHLPLLLDRGGNKLSKQNHAAPITPNQASEHLFQCLKLLRQNPPAELEGARPGELVNWAITHWQSTNIPKIKKMLVE
jgi:glutamyl-Q tRNA(Asp) synthetase